MAPRLGIASGTNPKKIEEQSSKLYRKKNEMQERQCHSLEEKSAGQLPNVKSV